MRILQRIKEWARRIKRDAVSLWFAYRDPDTPILVKALSILVVAYALSPIDLIPDFIPILGYLDDAILLPALIWLAVKMMPPVITERARAHADLWMAERGRRPTSYVGAVVIVTLWLLAAYGCWVLLRHQ